MRARARVAFVSLALVASGLAGCGSLDKLSDTTTGWLVSPESPPGQETSEPSAKDGQSGIKTADTPPENKDKPARKPRPRTAKAPKKTEAPARAAAAVQPQTPEPKSAPAQAQPVQLPWPAPPRSGAFSR
jgi:hypothetical protein